jgi:hypothetical protein
MPRIKHARLLILAIHGSGEHAERIAEENLDLFDYPGWESQVELSLWRFGPGHWPGTLLSPQIGTTRYCDSLSEAEETAKRLVENHCRGKRAKRCFTPLVEWVREADRTCGGLFAQRYGLPLLQLSLPFEDCHCVG